MLAIVFYLLIYVKSKDALHPLAIGVFIWFLTASLSNVQQFYDDSLQDIISPLTNFCIFISGFSFSLPFLLSKKLDKSQFKMQALYYTGFYKLLFNIVILVSLVAFLIRFNSIILTPPLLFGSSADLKNTVPQAIPFLNYFDIATPYLALLCFFELRYSINFSKTRKKLLIFYIGYAVISALLYKVSRGEFLIFVLGFLYLLFIAKKISFNFTRIFIVLSLVSLFLYVGALRISEGSRVSTQFGDGGLNIILSQIYTYVAMNFQNLNILVNSNLEPTYIWGSLKFFLKIFFNGLYEKNNIDLTDYTTSFFNAKTFIYYFYNDLGVAGIIIYPLIIGLILQLIYNKAAKDIKYYLLLACLMKAIIFMFFGNYFFGELVLLVPYLIALLFISMIVTVSTLRVNAVTNDNIK